MNLCEMKTERATIEESKSDFVLKKVADEISATITEIEETANRIQGNLFGGNVLESIKDNPDCLMTELLVDLDRLRNTRNILNNISAHIC